MRTLLSLLQTKPCRAAADLAGTCHRCSQQPGVLTGSRLSQSSRLHRRCHQTPRTFACTQFSMPPSIGFADRSVAMLRCWRCCEPSMSLPRRPLRMGQQQSMVQQPQQQQQQHPAQRAARCGASAAEAPSAAPGSTVQIGNDSKRKLTYVSYEANSWQATFEQTGAAFLQHIVALHAEDCGSCKSSSSLRQRLGCREALFPQRLYGSALIIVVVLSIPSSWS